MENNITKRGSTALVTALVLIALMKYGEYSLAGLLVITLVFGAVTTFLDRKNLGYGLLIGALLYALVSLLFGWTFMEGWGRPEDILQGNFKK